MEKVEITKKAVKPPTITVSEIKAEEEVLFFKEKKHVDQNQSIKIPDGQFALIEAAPDNHIRINAWFHCRDQFHNRTNNLAEMAFSHPAGIGKNVAAFIFQVEKKLGHSKLTTCGPTNFNRITWIRPAAFWTAQAVRRSLFTALLRAGLKYDPALNNFEKALFSIGYLRNSKSAVKRFLEGYTWQQKNSGDEGWYDRFSDVTAADVKVMLTMKPINEKQLMDFALEQLKLNREELAQRFRKEKYSKKNDEVAD